MHAYSLSPVHHLSVDPRATSYISIDQDHQSVVISYILHHFLPCMSQVALNHGHQFKCTCASDCINSRLRTENGVHYNASCVVGTDTISSGINYEVVFFRKIYIAKIKPPLELARFFWIRDKLASIYIWWIYSQVLQEFLIYFTKKTLKTKKENYCLHLKLQLILRYLEIYRCSVNLGA